MTFRFLHLADPDLWALYRRIGEGGGTNPSKPLRERFGARWALLVLPYQGAEALLDADRGLTRVWSNPATVLYTVNDAP